MGSGKEVVICRIYTYEAEKRRFFETQILQSEAVIRGIIRGILENPDDVNDAVQDTFLAAWMNLDQLTNRSLAESWVKSIAKNSAINTLRKNMRDDSISLNQPVRRDKEHDAYLGDFLSDTEPGPEEICVNRAELRSWYKAYTMLPEHYRLNLYLRYYMQMGTEEISERMGITQQAQIAACYRARKAMKKNFARIEKNWTYTASTSI